MSREECAYDGTKAMPKLGISSQREGANISSLPCHNMASSCVYLGKGRAMPRNSLPLTFP
jgi:hypothetical protein